jgi:riboflavin-specific deaminase-like protein
VNSKLKIKSSKLPHVFVNMAMTADGKIATANRAIHSFGSRHDLEHLYELRATADAILCGARTVEISEATLGNGGEKFRRRRLKNGRTEFPVRVVVSGSGSINPAAKIFQTDFSPLVILTTGRAAAKKLAQLEKLADEVKIFGGDEIDFPAALRWLREKFGVERLLCEGGGDLNDALFRAGLVDEINVTICPKIFGGRTAPTLAEGKGFSKLVLTPNFRLALAQDFKGELFTRFLRARNWKTGNFFKNSLKFWPFLPPPMEAKRADFARSPPVPFAFQTTRALRLAQEIEPRRVGRGVRVGELVAAGVRRAFHRRADDRPAGLGRADIVRGQHGERESGRVGEREGGGGTCAASEVHRSRTDAIR